jgi:hypothetical protein
MSERGTALIVADEVWKADLWTAWLREAGYSTISCPGPRVTFRCPREEGGLCAVRDMVDLAVVDVPEDPDGPYGGWPERSCTLMPDDGTTLFLHRASGPLEDGGVLQPTSKEAFLEELHRISTPPTSD